MSKKRPTEAEINYRYVGSATKSIHRSVKQASRDLESDYEKILRTYVEKGGFSSRQEALDYMNGHVQPEGYKALVERARQIKDPDIRRRELTRLSTDAYKFRMSRAKACDIAQGYHARELQDSIRRDLGQAKAKTAVTAAEQSLFNAQKTAGTGIGFDLPNTEQIRQIAYGTATEDRIKLFSDNEMKGIREVMDAGILSGRSYDEVAKQCERFTDNEFYKVRRLVRTEMAQASVDAELAEMEELGYKEYEVHCTLDEVTCEICGQHDGKVYKIDDTGHLPTYHPNCRCYITPIMGKEGKTRSARDAKGKSVKVPANMSYSEWKQKFAPELKVENRKFDLNTTGNQHETPIKKPTHHRMRPIIAASINDLKVIGFEVQGSVQSVDPIVLSRSTAVLTKMEQEFGIVSVNSPILMARDDGYNMSYVETPRTNYRKQTLSLCPSAFGNAEELTAHMIEGRNEGWFMSFEDGMAIEYAISHEYGHMYLNEVIAEYMEGYGWSEKYPDRFINRRIANIYKWYDDKAQRCMMECKSEIIAIAKADNPNFDLDKCLSEYGKTDITEFFPEVFANAFSGKPNELGHALSKWIKSRSAKK